jgi:hypothetical protein
MKNKPTKHFFTFLCMTLLAGSAYAKDDKSDASLPFMTVAESIAAMDKDHDGIVSVHEIRVFIEAMHGKGYQSKVFDGMEKAADNRSCGSSFSNSLY